MKKTTSLTFLLLFFVSSMSFASGSGGGPRPGMNLFGGVSGVGGIMPSSIDTKDAELVKLLGTAEQGKVIFKYKPAGEFKVETHKLDISEFNEEYLEALRKSAKSLNWEEVKIDVVK